MDFNERMQVCTSMLVNEALVGFTPPRGMNSDEQEVIVTRIAKALNGKLPLASEEGFKANLRRVFQNVQDVHQSYAWPTQAEFVAAVPVRGLAQVVKQEDGKRDYDKEVARCINENISVQESAVWGHQSTRLINKNLITRDSLDRYRKSSTKAFLDVYKGDAPKLMEQRYGDVVRPYL